MTTDHNFDVEFENLPRKMANYCYWNNKLGIDSSNCEVLTDEFVVWNSNT